MFRDLDREGLPVLAVVSEPDGRSQLCSGTTTLHVEHTVSDVRLEGGVGREQVAHLHTASI